MYRTLCHLESALRASLERNDLRRIYQETLVSCWPDIPDTLRAEKVAEFAARNGWSVAFRDDGLLGLVAEFSKASPRKNGSVC